MQKLDAKTGTLTIGDILIHPALTREYFEEDILDKKVEIDYYHDFQDNFIYTLKQRIHFNDKSYKVTLVFKPHKLKYIEIHNSISLVVGEVSMEDAIFQFLDLMEDLTGTDSSQFPWGEYRISGSDVEYLSVRIEYML